MKSRQIEEQQLQLAIRGVSELFHQRMHEGMLRPRSARILEILTAAASPEEMTPSRISQQMAVKPPTITPMLRRLEEEGLICRRHGEADRRLIYLAPTEEGRRRLEEQRRFCARVQREVFSPLTDEELGQMNRLYQKVLAALESPPPSQKTGGDRL